VGETRDAMIDRAEAMGRFMPLALVLTFWLDMDATR
jgi:hypothetical protein